jgi:hypothetical protein
MAAGDNGEGDLVWDPNAQGGPPFIGGFDLLIAKAESSRILA